MRQVARRLRLRSLWILLTLPLVALAGDPVDRSGLTRESYRKHCLMCHAQAPPEGVSQEILEGLGNSGLKPADLMPGLTCWRRCESCWPR